MGRVSLFTGFLLSVVLTPVLRAAASQAGPQNSGTEPSLHLDPSSLEREAQSALDRVQRNDIGYGIVDASYYIELAAHVGPDRAIPVLEAYFDRAHESDLRSEIASVLVSLGDKDPRFWNLILSQAQSALGEDPPDSFSTDGAGGNSAPCTSAAFLNWAKRRNLSPDEACEEASVDIEERIRPLVHTGDPRVIPILKGALQSQNPLIQEMAAQGLVLTRDRDAITLVIEAIKHASLNDARDLADTLIESDDPRAEAVVHLYMPDVNFAQAHQFRADLAQKERPILIAR